MTQDDINPILIDVPMPIETPRLILRPAREEDAQAIYEAKKKAGQKSGNGWNGHKAILTIT